MGVRGGRSRLHRPYGPFEDRETTHLAQQPFGQVPFLKDDGVDIFENGACLLHQAVKATG